MSSNRRLLLPLAACLAWCAPCPAQSLPKEHKVAAPTRLDWEFAAQGFGPGAAKLPANYDSTKQRYQLFVPKQASADRAMPLVLFIPAGDQPAGWDAWRTVCEQEGVLFASPFAAGNAVAPGQRTRVILDVLDDVRRRHRIDPDQTYVTGFSGGARMACAIGFALPEYFGGVAPLCGTNPLTGPTYLRHRIADRLSVAFVTGETDFNRKETAEYMAPWFEELGVRTKLWVVPKLGHAVPPAAVLREVYTWLREDLPRRRADAKAHPELAVGPDQAPAGEELAKRLLAAGRSELQQADHSWRAIALLQGAVQRGDGAAAAKKARQLLEDTLTDEAMVVRIAEQGGKDEQLALSSQARALERFGQYGKALEAWALLAKNYQGTTVGRNAEAQIQRLEKKLPKKE